MRKSLIICLFVLLVLLAGIGGAGRQRLLASESLPAATTEATAVSADYLLVLAMQPDGRSPDEQYSLAFALVSDRLAVYRQDGRLADFMPLPEMGAVLLQAPDRGVVEELRGTAVVSSVLPATAANQQRVAEYQQVMHQEIARVAVMAETAVGPESTAPSHISTLDDLTNLTVYLNDTYLYGYVDTPNIPITLTLKTGSTVKSQVNAMANSSGYFSAYFTAVIQGNNTIEVDLPGQPTEAIPVMPLTLQIDKATNVVSGSGPANQQMNIRVWSWTRRSSYYAYPMSNGSGNFSADFTPQIDIFLGDYVDLWASDANGYQFRINRRYVPGFMANTLSKYINGYAERGANVQIILKDSSNNIKSTLPATVNDDGYFFVYLPPAVEMVIGDRVEVQYGAHPVQSLQIVNATLDSINVTNDTVSGTSPANAKMEIYTYDEYTTVYHTLVVNANGAGQYTADFTGSADILRGSFASATYHDAQDNEQYTSALYAGPFARVTLYYWTDLWVVGQRNEAVSATLRNSLGAIKGTAVGVTGVTGGLSLNFLDSTGSSLDVLPGDIVEVDFASSADRTVNAVGINYITNRDTRTVNGNGPANSNLRLIYAGNTTSAVTTDVTTDASGNFSYTFSNSLTGGRSMQAIYRNPQGDDLQLYGYVPKFQVTYESGYLYGYGPFHSAVVATLRDSGGTIKEITNGTSNGYGYYWLYFSTPVNVGDIVAVDAGPLHYEQQIVPLNIAADVVNNIVYGTAPAGSWLNVYASNNFGPYYVSNHDAFYADTSGNFSVNFGEVRGGDHLAVLYWESGNKDQVYHYRYAPYVEIVHTSDRVGGVSTASANGNVTIRNSSGAIKATSPVTASTPYGFFSFWPDDTDIIPGDQVQTAVGILNQTNPVIPMNGTLNLNTDTASGTSLPNINLGVQVYHWRDTYYTTYTENGNMSQFVTTNGSGAFNLDLSAVADLTPGDYLQLYYYSNDLTRYQAGFYTTSPTVTVNDYPTAVQPNAPVPVYFTIANAAHPTSAYVRWGTSPGIYNYSTSWQQAGLGQNVITFQSPAGGAIYFKVLVYADGQSVWSDEHTIQVDATAATTLYDPVSGATNDNTPLILGVTAPNASVILYRNGTAVQTQTANAAGYFSFQISTPLSPGAYQFHAVATVDGTTGPNSNTVHLTIDPTLYVDPVHILLTARGQTQHLRDANGYANLGGRIWTRTGDPVAVSIPISYTTVYTADLYVGAIYNSPLLHSGDGIYVGSYTPPTSGTYALSLKFRGDGPSGPIYTVNILTGLIDPDGYVYDAESGADYRLAGATVTCYELVEGNWTAWNAAIWEQTNPQLTGADGYYAFFTLPGTYKVVVSAPGYWEYESPNLIVVDEPVHHNVPLRRIYNIYLPVIVR